MIDYELINGEKNLSKTRAIQATLYDLVWAVGEELPEQDDLVASIVRRLLRKGRAKFIVSRLGSNPW